MIDDIISSFLAGQSDKKYSPTEEYYNENTGRSRGFTSLENQLKVLATFGFTVVNDQSLQEPVYPVEIADGILPFLRNRKDPRVLDAPCGLANIEKDLIGLDPNIEYVGFDLFPPALRIKGMTLSQVDLDTDFHIEKPADLVLSLYGIRYLCDPVKFVDRLIANCKPGATIVINGVNPIYKTLRNGRNSNFFESQSEVSTDDLLIYYIDDWVIIHVINPEFRFQATIDSTRSITRSNNPPHMWTDTKFYY